MVDHHAADLTVKKVRSKPDRRSLPLVLVSEATIPKSPRRSLPSDENAVWDADTPEELRCKSFNSRKSIGCTWDDELCDYLGAIDDSPLKHKARRSQSGRFSLSIASVHGSEEADSRRSSTYLEPRPHTVRCASSKARPSLTVRTASWSNIINRQQLDGTTDANGQDGLSSSIAHIGIPSPAPPGVDLQSDSGLRCQVDLPTPPPTPPFQSQEIPTRSLSPDLADPGDYLLGDKREQSLETPTPPTRESRARSSFPFPLVDRKDSPLSSFSPRTFGSPLRPSQQSRSSRSRSGSTTPSQTPDRFIPPRRPQAITRESFQLSTPPSKLSASEKLRRNRDPASDPFGRRRRSASASRPSSRSLPVRAIRQNSNLPSSPNSPFGLGRLSLATATRQISHGAVWAVGGAAASADSVAGVSNGRGGLLANGSSAPLYRSNFLDRLDSASERDAHERRIALALDLDLAARVLHPTLEADSSRTNHRPMPTAHKSFHHIHAFGPTVWKDGQWTKEGSTTTTKKSPRTKRAVPIIPFRVLDAPSLRDDFYCSLLAYSENAKCLAVGLGSHVYLWSEGQGVDTPESLNAPYHAHVTSMSFSSNQSKKDILAIGRACGRLLLWSPSEETPRLTSIHPSPVCCVSFRPNPIKRPSKRDRYLAVDTEELILGDEAGHIYFYSIEWPSQEQYDLFSFPGDLSLLCRITIHTQQICGLAWSPDGDFFASGGNDNICHLFETKRVLQHASTDQVDVATYVNHNGPNPRIVNITTTGPSFSLGPFVARHQWTIFAAVKAIAFCPWQRGLIAVGGGSNDRCIHFYHTLSGACLATIDCSAQVTSLIWSTTRREIAATFGFAQPEHPYRIAVFSWPKCEVVVRIPWFEEHRALFAIPYPGGPNNGQSKGEGGVWWSRTQEEGCIVVATSDSSIKFHEVWAEERKSVNSKGGLLGGSDILEALHGIEKEQAEVIR